MGAEREEKLNSVFMEACAKVLTDHKSYLKSYYLNHSDQLADCLIQTIKKECQHIKLLQQMRKKGKLACLQLSFLMSGRFSNEHLLKIDFFDSRFYADPYDIDCFWDYGQLFPDEDKKLEEITFSVRKRMQKVMDYEIEERLLTYRLGQMQLLQPILKELLQKKDLYTSLSVEAEKEISVLYGGYMGSFQRLCTLQCPKSSKALDITGQAVDAEAD